MTEGGFPHPLSVIPDSIRNPGPFAITNETQGKDKGKEPGSPIGVGDDREGAGEDKNASWRLRAGLGPGPVHFIWGRGLSERSEFRSPHHRDRGTGTPSWGPRPGANGFGFFCRNKRLVLSGAEGSLAKEPRRAGAKPRRRKGNNPGCPIKPGMTEGGFPHPLSVIPDSIRNPGPFAITNETQGKDKGKEPGSPIGVGDDREGGRA